MNEQATRRHRLEARQRHNEEFVRLLQQRRPAAKAFADALEGELKAKPAALDEAVKLLKEERAPEASARRLALETIVKRERPVLLVESDWINKAKALADGEEAKDLIAQVDARRELIEPLMPLVGRVDAVNFPGSDYVGTGWFVAPDIVVTNRHVASLVARWDGRRFAFRRGVAGNLIESSLCTAHEHDDPAPERSRSFPVTEVLYIEKESGPDIAFLRVARRPDGARRPYIEVSEGDVSANVPVLVVGYPARAPKSVIPDQKMMEELYQGLYDVKRAAPGYTMSPRDAATRHDCTTLGGNSGSVVLDLKTGRAVGLHFAGLYQESNYAVRASVLAAYVRERRWTRPPLFEVRAPAAPVPDAAPQAPGVPVAVVAAGGVATVTVPLTITVSLGAPSAAPLGLPAAGTSIESAEAAVADFWDQRPEGVVAARLGFAEEDGEIGDRPIIAAAVRADQLAALQANGRGQFMGLEVLYFAADAAEIAASVPGLEAVESVSYDDDARTGEEFSFETVSGEEMSVLAHVGPEYSWDELEKFLKGARRRLVSAIYEFHGAHVAKVLEERLRKGVNLDLVMDNATFIKVKNRDEEFERVERFKAWEAMGGFKRIVAPEGSDGLIANAYHIKVTVRDDDTLWLSSGNWKMHSSQPVITAQQRADALTDDLPGNREWHVMVESKTLAKRFRSHILQDYKRSKELGGGVVPKSLEGFEEFVDVPVELVPERRPPAQLLEPREFTGRIRVKPLLTPDDSGAVYSEAVLELIRGARESLLFQIPYIGMPSNPRADRGYIDALIKALAQKLKDLDDARVLLRSGGSAYSRPAHAAWYFKSKGVDIKQRVRQLEDHHTKGMIVDGQRVLIGSHNWSAPGVTLNRDASLLFDDERIAAYYGEAFEIDWARSSAVTPKRYKKEEGVPHAVGEAPPGYRRVRLADLVKEQEG